MHNIIYSSSDIYSQFCFASISSMLQNNPDVHGKVNFFILSNGISELGKEKFRKLVQEFHCNVTFIETNLIKNLIESKGFQLNFNVSSFIRIFMPILLPDYVDKALFIDSDTYINSGITDLLNLDMGTSPCAMVLDQPLQEELQSDANLKYNENYFNAGVMLVSLNQWRENDYTNKMIRIYERNPEACRLDDQTVINNLLANKTMVLPYKFNVMKHVQCLAYKHFCRINQPAGFHTYEEYKEAHDRPVVIHYNGPSLRPWHKWTVNPLRNEFIKEVRKFNPHFKYIKPDAPLYARIASWIMNRIIYKLRYSIYG